MVAPLQRWRSRIGRALAVAGALGAVFSCGVAHAQRRDPREVEAQKFCLGGHPEKGIELLAELYAEKNDPNYIYNQARCFEQNGRSAEAATRFREYLRLSPNLPVAEREKVVSRIADLEKPTPPVVTPLPPNPAPPAGPPPSTPASSAAVSSSGQPPVPSGPPAVPALAPAPAVAQPASADVHATVQVAPPPSSIGLRTAAWIGTVVTPVALGLGIVEDIVYLHQRDVGQNGSLDTSKALSITGFVTAGLVGTVTVVLFVMSHPPSHAGDVACSSVGCGIVF